MLFVILIILGLILGFVSSLFGVGGGFLIVPTLLYLFPESPFQLMTGISLGVITINSTINSYNYWKIGKRITLKTCFILGIGMILGNITGSFISTSFSFQSLKTFFGIIVFLSAIKTLLLKPKSSFLGLY